MDKTWHIYLRWLHDRRRSTIVWSLSIAAVSVVTAAFFESLGQTAGQNTDSGSAASSMLGLGAGIDPRTPVGFLWAMNYSNQLPWLLMALGIALGTAAVAGDESEGTLEYLLSKPVTRTEVAMARFGGMVTILVMASIVNLVAVAITAPLFGLTDDVALVNPDGTTTMAAGVTMWDLTVGGLGALAVALGSGSLAYLVGAATGRRGVALGAASGIAVAGYVLYTLSNVTGDYDWLSWFSPWRWFIDDAMMVNGLSADILWPVLLAIVSLIAGWQLFLRRDLQS
ncbi:MAG: ABC transporter permease subunit [Acidimicrobiales bacterium]|nr:ABC transporter permease subunit [Acidimicrobiales bacterium]